VPIIVIAILVGIGIKYMFTRTARAGQPGTGAAAAALSPSNPVGGAAKSSLSNPVGGAAKSSLSIPKGDDYQEVAQPSPSNPVGGGYRGAAKSSPSNPVGGATESSPLISKGDDYQEVAQPSPSNPVGGATKSSPSDPVRGATKSSPLTPVVDDHKRAWDRRSGSGRGGAAPTRQKAAQERRTRRGSSTGGSAKVKTQSEKFERFQISDEQHVLVVFNSPKQKQYMDYIDMILFGSCSPEEKAMRDKFRTFYCDDEEIARLSADINVNRMNGILPILVYTTFCPTPRFCITYSRYLDIYKACLSSDSTDVASGVSFTLFILKRGIIRNETMDEIGARKMVMDNAGVDLPRNIFRWTLIDADYKGFDKDNEKTFQDWSKWMTEVIVNKISKAPKNLPTPIPPKPQKTPRASGGASSSSKPPPRTWHFEEEEDDECEDEPIDFFEEHQYLKSNQEWELAEELGWKNPMHYDTEVVPVETDSSKIFRSISATCHPDKIRRRSPRTKQMLEEKFKTLNNVNDLLKEYRDLSEDEIPLAIELGWVDENKSPLQAAPPLKSMNKKFNKLFTEIRGTKKAENQRRRLLCEAYRKYLLHYSIMREYRNFMNWLVAETGSYFVFYRAFTPT